MGAVYYNKVYKRRTGAWICTKMHQRADFGANFRGSCNCIILDTATDPPYNTGAKDWKYNNDYVDSTDQYRHSKWLSMMKKRLELAKKLLDPADSVLIVTIDEKEYLHLGCLLEDMFKDAKIQMISTITNPAGVTRAGTFSRTNEYIYFVFIGDCCPTQLKLENDWIGEIKSKKRKESLRWNTLLRSGTDPLRSDSPKQFYPIYVSKDVKKIISVGEPYFGQNRNEVIAPDGCIAIFPIRSNGEEGRWQVSRESLLELIKKGYVKLGKFNNHGSMAIDYLKRGEIEKVENGTFPIVGYEKNGTIIVDDANYKPQFVPGCQWNISSHDSTQQGTKIVNSIIGERFSFPKSLYAVHDALRFFVANKPNALIVDFFAGSGTTLHAVNLLNAEDGGQRRCILVTNNEVSANEANSLFEKGYQPGDEEWEKLGIARYVTWPRTVCSIEGHDINGEPLKGNYLGSDIPMSDGFKANVAYFKLGFLDKTSVALGRQFRELLPILWLKAGAYGKCPELENNKEPKMLILSQNRFAVLCDEAHFPEFREKITDEIETIFFVTDFEQGYITMASNFSGKHTYQLYRDYLDNFRINTKRD